METLARQFIAGSDPEDAWPTLEALRGQGLAISVDLLGEEVLSEGEAAIYTRRYLDLLNVLSRRVRSWPASPLLENDHKGTIPRLDVSVKVSSFSCRLDPMDWDWSVRETVAGLKPVVEAAKTLGVAITFDMESYYFKDLIIAIVKRALEEQADGLVAGIALQTYLKETKDDLVSLISWAKKSRRRLGLRLTKGAYWDYETVVNRQRGWPIPVLLEKAETDAQYEELTRILLENAAFVRPALATHNVRSICHAIATADDLKLPKEALEFQMIYGMAEPIRAALQKMGYRVRVYAPIGELIPGMAYLIRRLLENTSNESFLRKSFSEGTNPDELTRAPQISGHGKHQEAAADRFFVNEPTDGLFQVPEPGANDKCAEQGEEDLGPHLSAGDRRKGDSVGKGDSLNQPGPTYRDCRQSKFRVPRLTQKKPFTMPGLRGINGGKPLHPNGQSTFSPRPQS